MVVASTPALLGGRPVNPVPFPPYNSIGADERKAVLGVLETGVLSGFVASPGPEFWGGPRVQAVESAFREYFGVRFAVAVNSATSALHCAVMAMGAGPGDEVIVPPYTMSATATTVLMTGATPVFADIDPDTFCLDPAAVEAAVSPRTVGIVAVNLFGHPAPLDRLRAIADRRGLFLVEDSAQAPGGIHHGRYAGTVGDAGVFSLNRHKMIQCGEGGVLVTDDERVATKAALVRNHGEVVVESLGLDDIVNTIGWNYRMTELEAAVALEQFRKLDALNAERIRLAEFLTRRLDGFPGIIPPVVREGCRHVYYFYVMRYDAEEIGIPRDLFARAVKAEGCYLRAGYVRPIYLEPLFQKRICFGPHGYPFVANPRGVEISYAKGICPTTERLEEHEVILTNITYPPLTTEHMDLFVRAIEKTVEGRAALREFASREARA